MPPADRPSVDLLDRKRRRAGESARGAVARHAPVGRQTAEAPGSGEIAAIRGDPRRSAWMVLDETASPPPWVVFRDERGV
jgi:hypothetical protein